MILQLDSSCANERAGTLRTRRGHHGQRGTHPERTAGAGDERYPTVTVVRPIKGLDPGLRENLEAALAVDYPGKVETIFVLDGEEEPALPLLREVLDGHEAAGHRAHLLLCGAPPMGRTGKLHAMIAGLRRASGELVAFADSDTRPHPRTLRILVETLLARPEAGSAFAPVVANLAPRTLGDAGYAVLMNGLYGPAAAKAAQARRGSLPFIMGQFMVLRREAIEAIGGLECADGQLIDDMYLGQRIHEAGYSNMVAPLVLPIASGGLSARDFAALYRRWIAFGRSGLPAWELKAGPWLRNAIFWLGMMVGALGGLSGSAWASAAGMVTTAGVAASINRLHRRIGGAPFRGLHRAAAYLVLLAAPAVFLSLQLKREVTWRGRRYTLNSGSRLADSGSGAITGRGINRPRPRREAPMQLTVDREGDCSRLLRDHEDERIREPAHGQCRSMAPADRATSARLAPLRHHGKEDSGSHDPRAPHDDRTVVQDVSGMKEAREESRRELRVEGGASLDVVVEALLPFDDDSPPTRREASQVRACESSSRAGMGGRIQQARCALSKACSSESSAARAL